METNDFYIQQQQDPYIHYCLACALIDFVIPCDSMGNHIGCTNPSTPHDIKTSETTKEQWISLPEEEKERRRSILKINSQSYTAFCSQSESRPVQQNIPRCPTCQSTSISKISTLNRVLSIHAWGIFSNKINKQFKCENCGYMW